MIKRLLCMMAVISLCSFTIDDPFLTLLKKLEEFTKRYPTEKVYLHLDKPYYAAGDNIWFKAYVNDGRTAQPTAESNILYVELINESDSICNKLRLPMQNGVSWGDFKLVDTLLEGNYRIRAYTQLMRNGGPDFFFDKTIKIGSKWTNKASAKTTFDNYNSSIVFTDNTEKPILNKNVSYTIKSGLKNFKGKTKTDSIGRARITLPQDALNGSIIASIDLGKGQKSTKIIPIKPITQQFSAQFLPEGGTLIQGISSRIGVKAIDANGKGIDIKGVIIDNTGEEITTFQTTHLGMGSFYFNPLAGRSYRAKMKRNDGVDYLVNLPKAENSGYLLSVNQLDTASINVKVMLSADLINKGELNLIAHRNGMVFLNVKVATAKQVTKISIPSTKFPSGIVELTLFSPQNLPIAERLVFVNNTVDKVDVNLGQLKPTYQKREKVALELAAATQGNFSVAITNADVVSPDEENESNILTTMLLGSGLKGYIEKPNYYFLNTDVVKREHLDNLLLTQGWRKIDWKGFANSPVPNLNFKPEKSIRISGTITKDKLPLANSKISLVSNTRGMFVVDTISDKNGRFTFEGLTFLDSTKFIIQARSELGKKTVDITLDLIEEQKVTPVPNYGDIEVNVNQAIESYLKESSIYFEELNRQGLLSKTILLKEVQIEGKKLVPSRNSTNLHGALNADQVFDGDDMINAPNISHYLFGKLTGMTIKNGRPELIGGRGIGPVKLIVDGFITDPEVLVNDIKPEDVESIEILVTPVKSIVYKSSAMIITTKRGRQKWPAVKYAPGIATYFPKGYYNVREFYSPKYDAQTNNKPDLRTTVFWSPNLVTDGNGKAKFDYFNTDQTGNYRIVIEGVDTEGRLARKTYSYKVN